ncbi:cutinase [Morchella conica CCBAS932]|uniref:Cutinase n=1 Tax=Morchella conica CCBAS932 TaxID=1392247 RepID=A0A3N4L1C6_9PEZI|nr:cutinase [Morchella conica CCBAS932]
MKLFITLALLVSSTLTASLPAPSNTVDPETIVNSPIYQAYKGAFSANIGGSSENSIVTRNDLIDGKCNDVIVIFARGSTEPGNIGITLGPVFFDAIEKVEPGRIIAQGVNDYPASISEALAGGSKTGAKYMVSMVSLAASQCPESKVVLSGYSQGAQVTHLAAGYIPEDLYSKVAAIVLFGDPDDGDAFPGSLNDNVATFCKDGDRICEGFPIPSVVHFTYQNDVGKAAAYIAERV